MSIKISVCGCSLIDHLFTNISFRSPEIAPYLSKNDGGDGGIAPGKLVFAEDLEKFADKPYDEIISEITKGKKPDALNLGGPALVGAIHVAQLLQKEDIQVSLYGACSSDENGKMLLATAGRTPLNMTNFRMVPGSTPVTDVLSDPDFYHGKGERLFINRIGTASAVNPDMLDDSFWQSDVIWFSATALTPAIHDNLTSLLKKAKERGSFTIVSTVFDFRNEKKDPVGCWPLGESSDSYKYIDLLIMDYDEAMRLSGQRNLADAADVFIHSGVSAFFITHGAHEFYVWSDGRCFQSTQDTIAFPVSALADQDMAEHPERIGDTTGCGDNFAGGIVASLLNQLLTQTSCGELKFDEAAAWGAASGGAACFYKGGTYVETFPGEKMQIIARYIQPFLQDSRVKQTMADVEAKRMANS